MDTILSFLRALAQNNDRNWFLDHKPDYEEARRRFEDLALRFIEGVAAFDERCRGLTLKDCTYRIYRDIRFSADKSPYKTHFGVYVCPQGKKSGRAGYYLHLQPHTEEYFLCAGLYNPTPAVLHSIRDDVAGGGGEALRQALALAPDFALPWDKALRRIPKGYDPADDFSEFYRLRSFELMKPLTLSEVRSAGFLQNSLKALSRTHAFNELLNRAVDYLEN